MTYFFISVFEGGHYTDKADVYSLGIVFWELVAGKKVISLLFFVIQIYLLLNIIKRLGTRNME
jgi:serine/threonine protein kinase